MNGERYPGESLPFEPSMRHADGRVIAISEITTYSCILAERSQNAQSQPLKPPNLTAPGQRTDGVCQKIANPPYIRCHHPTQACKILYPLSPRVRHAARAKQFCNLLKRYPNSRAGGSAHILLGEAVSPTFGYLQARNDI